MKYRHPLRQILSKTRSHWDRDQAFLAARWALGKALQCQTAELGAEIYVGEEDELVVYHTCKSRACPSCGYRANVQWLRERWTALPDAIYKGITFTMPDVLWPFFRDNPHLSQALPALAASVIQAMVSATYGSRVGVIAILHTFNGQLKFNSHVHTMVSGGALSALSGRWTASVYYNRERLMEAWRRAVIKLLRTALHAGQLRTNIAPKEMGALLNKQEARWWSIKIQSFNSKGHFLRYAGRYVRRPPIAQRRITFIGERSVTFWFNDKKQRRRMYVTCSLEEFVNRWAQHIPERYQHTVRSFGLFAPRALCQTSAAMFLLLGQMQRPRPKPRSWALSLRRDFGHDPLRDGTGKRRRWTRRLPPKTYGANH
jgi:putative transposase/transposase-like zinc-binding protein